MKRTAILRRTSPIAKLSIPVFRPKLCRMCKEQFTPVKSMQCVCGPSCAGHYAVFLREKERTKAAAEERRETKAKLEKIKSRAKWLSECQAIVNRYVRLRDRNDGCISCHLPASWDGQWHASHFRSVGAATSVRFNLWNIHKACSACNGPKSGNIHAYRPRIIEKIGQERFDFLEAQNQRADYSVEYLKRLKAVMGKRLRRLERRLA